MGEDGEKELFYLVNHNFVVRREDGGFLIVVGKASSQDAPLRALNEEDKELAGILGLIVD